MEKRNNSELGPDRLGWVIAAFGLLMMGGLGLGMVVFAMTK